MQQLAIKESLCLMIRTVFIARVIVIVCEIVSFFNALMITGVESEMVEYGESHIFS